MSAFDKWIDNLNESRPNRQSFSTGPVMVWMRMAFDAGLEEAAKAVQIELGAVAGFKTASKIRALKEQTDESI